MGRINAVLDEEIDYGFEGGPRYSTAETDMENGFVEKDSEWVYPRHEYSASFGDIDDDVRDEIISVFHACRGKRHSFLFKDWNDYTITNQLIEVEPGTSKTIQLYKKYSWGQVYSIRPIQAIKSASLTDANGDQVPGSFNLMTGEFTPLAAWGTGEYKLTCEFYVWVSFEADYNPMTINSWRANTASVELVEDKFKFTATNVPASWEE
jgi:uncharacterized protein (TIGR02217 family)